MLLPHDGIERGEHLALGVQVLHDGLDDDVRRGEIGNVRRAGQLRQSRVARLRRHLAALDARRQEALDAAQPPVDERLIHLAHDGPVARLRADLGDARSHQATPQHAYRPHRHLRPFGTAAGAAYIRSIISVRSVRGGGTVRRAAAAAAQNILPPVRARQATIGGLRAPGSRPRVSRPRHRAAARRSRSRPTCTHPERDAPRRPRGHTGCAGGAPGTQPSMASTRGMRRSAQVTAYSSPRTVPSDRMAAGYGPRSNSAARTTPGPTNRTNRSIAARRRRAKPDISVP